MSPHESSGESLQQPPPLSHDVLEYERTAKQAAASGELLTAIEVAREGLKRYGPNRLLQQQLALALAQTGALDGARDVLAELLKTSAKDEETLCLLGRVQKELWRRAKDPAVGAEALRQACKCYGDAFALNQAYYPGINLAFALAAMGDLKEAEACARRVEKICRAELAAEKGEGNGWLFATLAEAQTHQGATVNAGENYRRAAEAFKGRWRDQASMRRQAHEILGFYARTEGTTRGHWYDVASIRRRLREKMGQTEQGTHWLDRCFEFPSVVMFAGHMIDSPGRSLHRFPPEREEEVREAIRAYLRKVRPGFGYSSAACGADLIFCECLLEMDAKVHLVLPCPVDAFKRQSVSFGGPEWERRFHAVLGCAATSLIVNSSDFSANGDSRAAATGLVYTNRIITGLAVLQAQALDFELKALAVWDGKPGEGDGGTASVVAEWRERHLSPHIIRLEPNGIQAATAAPFDSVSAHVPAAPAEAGEIRHEIKALLSAEVLNYQKVREWQLPAFVREFGGAVAKMLAGRPSPPAVKANAGNTYFFAFDDLGEAAHCALAFRDLVDLTPWKDLGLPEDLGIRLVLHAGPVYGYEDPVTRQPACLGSHAQRAARIQPVTPRGQVYASQEFAALCSAEDLSAVSFEFLGHVRTARLMEEAPLYRLDRKGRELE